ncbi:carboxy terminal-processing peptidase [Capnocytophaga canimorsus]|uniref:C-terminal-processing peptidase n=2 Tax=Capnocytophaga canimorsus TaxID=28188 RepID=F9YQG6_CAPCC|nr:carboxy terminal-processing peptidase [Capnocytophaga canimorsus]AEK23505.1 C-terminal-processing peptidase [Capnocytophaga canimorsus Cc5]VEJ18583.1 Tail-specific protease precursor [Capnocytophaga canimorsus]
MKSISIFLTLLFISFASCSFVSKKFENPDKDKLLLEIIQYVIYNGHYNPGHIDDEFSKKVYKNYIEILDGQKRYFLQSDIKEFEKYETRLDDDLKKGDITFFNITHNRLTQRMNEAKVLSEEILKKRVNLFSKETINVDYENLPYAKNKAELRERWNKIIVFSTLSTYLVKEKEETDKKEKNAQYKLKTATELQQEAQESSQKNLVELFGFYQDLTREDWFGFFVNAITESFDPHTNYLAPEAKDRFDRDISGKFEGIGAQLQKKTDGIRITSIILGGPVWKGKLLEVGDQILKVAQGDEEPVDVVGMRLDNAVNLIKGPKGTEVRLTVKRVDGTIEVVSIIRDVVEIEETFAKSAIVQDQGRTYGIIDLPKFYVDFQDYKERNAASDMALEIEKLKKQGIEGLVLDLRNNGGGSLKTVVDIGGMFIEKGPIVQVKSTGRNKEVLSDSDPQIQWDGPLVILVNELSASASEILAAAMQDYKRAVVIGGKQTYGKGTVQSVVDLNRFMRNSDMGDLGALKITTQKFYRISGGSTQLEGVKSDVSLPDKYTYIDIGERDLDNAMHWDKIEPANYQLWERQSLNTAIENSKKRMAGNDYLKLIDENARWVKQQQDQNTFSLNYDIYKKTIENNEEQSKRFKALSDYKNGLTFKSVPSQEIEIQKNEDLKLRRDRWHEGLLKDIYIKEAIDVLHDLKQN